MIYGRFFKVHNNGNKKKHGSMDIHKLMVLTLPFYTYMSHYHLIVIIRLDFLDSSILKLIHEEF